MNARRRTTRWRAPRRGFVLLVILAMLAMLVVFMVTFIVVATQFREAAVSSAQTNLAKEDPRRVLDNAVYDLLRDTTDVRSALRGHSLLSDMYGNDGFTATIRSGTTPTRSYCAAGRARGRLRAR